MTRIDTRVRAVMYGCAVGDALGVPFEMKTAEKIKTLLPIEYRATSRKNGESFLKGQYSDDTELTLALLDGYLDGTNEDDTLDEFKTARRFVEWAKTGAGMGAHTKVVLFHPDYLTAPFDTARKVWAERPAGAPHPNGAVMRAAAVGLMRPWDAGWTVAAAFRAADLTHPSTPCRVSTMLIALTVGGLVCGEKFSIINNVVCHNLPLPTSSWGLSRLDQKPMGETHKPVEAAEWALQHAESWWHGVESVIKAGGDTDTNAAVTGAVLGAHFGIGGEKGIPEHLIAGLHNREVLDQRIERLLATYP